MNKLFFPTLAATAISVGCSTTTTVPSGSGNIGNSNGRGQTVDMYPNIVTGKLTFIDAEEAKRRNVAHMVTKYRGKVEDICHFGFINIPVQGKMEKLVGTAGHCVAPENYTNPNGTVNNQVDYIIARSLTRLFPQGSGIEFVTTDNPKILERSDLYGSRLHGAMVEINGCLPHGKSKNTSTCFNFRGQTYMTQGVDGKATVYFDRAEYIQLLKKSERSCEQAVISGVSGNYFIDSSQKIVGFASTALNACHQLYKETVYNKAGIPLRVNAFPVQFEPIRHPGNNGKTNIILN